MGSYAGVDWAGDKHDVLVLRAISRLKRSSGLVGAVVAQERQPIAIGIGDEQGASAGCHQAGTGWAGTLPVEVGCPGGAVGGVASASRLSAVCIAFMRLIWVGE